ncbi:MAG: hypothetical protein AAGJ82_07705 [Bacteroidota bacterium]
MTALHYLLSFTCFFLSATSLIASSPEQELEQHLTLLIPGNGPEAQSARMYAQQRIGESMDRLTKRKIHKKKAKKAKQILVEEVETHFLKHYEARASMQGLFKEGNFDQTSATALYAILMEYLDWPYELRVVGMEVVLYYDPLAGGERIEITQCPRLNTTSETQFRSAYLDFVRFVGHLETTVWENSTTDDIFTTNYLGATATLSVTQLASFSAMRQAFKAYEKRAWTAAQDWLLRSRQLYRFPVQEVLERAVWLQLANAESSGYESLFYLWKLWEERRGTPWQGELIKRFNNNIVAREAVSVWQIDSLYTDFQRRFQNDVDAQVQLKEMYYLQRARFHAQEGRAVPVMNFMDSLYHLRPGDTDIQDVLAGMLVWTLQPVRNFSDGLERIDYYQKRYPFLQNNVLFQDQHLYYQAERVRHFFDQDDYANGWSHWLTFKTLSEEVKQAPRFASWVSTAYLSISNYYLRQGDPHSARGYVRRAANLLPNDDYLQHRVNLLQRYR